MLDDLFLTYYRYKIVQHNSNKTRKMSSSSHVEGIVNAPIDEVWKTFKGFGKSILEFWKTIKEVELDGEDEVRICM